MLLLGVVHGAGEIFSVGVGGVNWEICRGREGGKGCG